MENDNIVDLFHNPKDCPDCDMDDAIYYESFLFEHGGYKCLYCPWYMNALTGEQYDYYKRNSIFPGSGVGIQKLN